MAAETTTLQVYLPPEVIECVQQDCARFRITHGTFASTAWALRSNLNEVGIAIDKPFQVDGETYTPPPEPIPSPKVKFYIGKITLETYATLFNLSERENESLDEYSTKSFNLLHDLIEFDAPNPLPVEIAGERYSFLLHDLPLSK